MEAISDKPTAYAIRCPNHGQVFLTKEGYDVQMNRANSRWACPMCGESASWDDNNYDAFNEEQNKNLNKWELSFEDKDVSRMKMTFSSDGKIRLKFPPSATPNDREKMLQLVTHIAQALEIPKQTLRGHVHVDSNNIWRVSLKCGKTHTYIKYMCELNDSDKFSMHEVEKNMQEATSEHVQS